MTEGAVGCRIAAEGRRLSPLTWSEEAIFESWLRISMSHTASREGTKVTSPRNSYFRLDWLNVLASLRVYNTFPIAVGSGNIRTPPEVKREDVEEDVA